MDGNARWAKKKKINKKNGYKKGLNKIKEVVEICIEKKIRFLTLYALSSENLKRPNVNIIFDIFSDNFNSFMNYISNKNEVKINFFGQKNNIPLYINKIISAIESKTMKNNQLFLNVAFNYGSKDELIYCINSLLKKNINNKIFINEKIIRNNLFLKNIPDPDILIRTGGFQRLSNFLLFQLSYTELFFTKTLWPDLSKKEINSIFNKYSKIERKYGL